MIWWTRGAFDTDMIEPVPEGLVVSNKNDNGCQKVNSRGWA